MEKQVGTNCEKLCGPTNGQQGATGKVSGGGSKDIAQELEETQSRQTSLGEYFGLEMTKALQMPDGEDI